MAHATRRPTGCKGSGATCSCGVNQTADDHIIAKAVGWLQRFESDASLRPFFLAVGLHRPHLPWSVPQEFFDLYNESGLALAKHETAPTGMPPIAWHSCSREEDACFNGCVPGATDSPFHPATGAEQRKTRHGYYAAVSYADDRVGRVLGQLGGSTFANSTISVIHGDHGWQLGDNGEYCKQTLFENALRTPLMIRVPWLTHSHGMATSSLVELIDVYPTLQELAGYPVSPELEGVSQAGLLTAPPGAAGSTRKVALAQFPRCIAPGSEAPSRYWDANNCNSNTSDQYTAMGHTMRTADGWRYTRWVRWNGSSLAPEWAGDDYGEELYDFRNETALGDFDMQSANLAADAGHAGLVAVLREQLEAEFTKKGGSAQAPSPGPVIMAGDAGSSSGGGQDAHAATRAPVLVPAPTALEMASSAAQLILANYKNFTDVSQLRGWQAANAIDSFAMFAEVAGPAACPTAAATLAGVFELITTTPDPHSTCLGGWGTANDDQQWGLFAWVRAYHVTNDTRFLLEAGKYHDWVTANERQWRAHNASAVNRCGSLGYHNAPAFGPGRQDFKNTITNTQMVLSSMLLHPHAALLGKPPAYYLGIAKDTFAWLEHVGLRNASSTFWLNGLDMSTCNVSNPSDPGQAWPCTYNQGVILAGLGKLALAEAGAVDERMFGVACEGVAAVAARGGALTTAEGILHEAEPACDSFWGGPCRRWAIFKGAFFRSLADFGASVQEALARGGTNTTMLGQCLSTIQSLASTNANAVWANARCPVDAPLSPGGPPPPPSSRKTAAAGTKANMLDQAEAGVVAAAAGGCTSFNDTDFHGDDLASHQGVHSASACCALCTADDRCYAAAWNGPSYTTCYLKGSEAVPVRDHGTTGCHCRGPTPPPVPPPPPPGPRFSYDWTGARADFGLSCDGTDTWTNIKSQNVAAADVLNAHLALAGAAQRRLL